MIDPLRSSASQPGAGTAMLLARYGAQTDFHTLPATVVERTKLVLLDTVCAILTGRSLPPGSLIASYVESQGGRPEASVSGTLNSTTAGLAALANGTASHADEMDDAHVTGSHPASCVIPAVLAVSEEEGCSGQETINAIALGYDIGCRLIRAAGGQRSLMGRAVHPDFLHSLGAALACCRLMRLDEDQYPHAAALAAARASGLAAFFEERQHMSKALACGHAAEVGVTAAVLARMGFEGNDDVFESQNGILACWSQDRDVFSLVEGLGERYEILETNLKRYSAGYPIQAPVYGLLTALRDNGLRVDELREIKVELASHALGIVSDRSMKSISLRDMLVVALLEGDLSFQLVHSTRVLGGASASSARSLITIGPSALLDDLNPDSRQAIVTLSTIDGRTIQTSPVSAPWDHSTPPMWSDVARKFRTSLPEMSEENMDAIIDYVGRLDELPSIAPLVERLSLSTITRGLNEG